MYAREQVIFSARFILASECNGVNEQKNGSCPKGGILEDVKPLIGNRIGSLYIIGQNDNIVYCHCSNCGKSNIEYSYNEIMNYINKCSHITCGCENKVQSIITENLIDVKYNRLTIVKQINNEMVECRCSCGKVLEITIDELKNNGISMCKECKKKTERLTRQISVNRNSKELYYIWNKFLQLYKKPTKRFEREIIKNGIKFFPSILEKKDCFELFSQWAIVNGYGKIGFCYLERINHFKDYDFDNCYWTCVKTDSYYKLPKINEHRDL